MKQYVIGNDIDDIYWDIYSKNDLPEDFSDAFGMALFAQHRVFPAVKITAAVSIRENRLSLVLGAAGMRKPGVYDLILEYKKPDLLLPDGTRNRRVVNCSAFQLVERSCEIDLPDDPLVIEGIVDALRGYSAYEVAKKNGFTGTEAEWLASLKGDAFTYDDFTPGQIEDLQRPATEAAEIADEAAGIAVEAALSASEAADAANDAAGRAGEAAGNADEKADYARQEGENAHGQYLLAQAATDRANEATDNVNAAVERLSAVGVLSYGIEWDTTVANPACIRIGNPDLHRIQPIQSRMRRCLLLDDGTVNYYLHPNDSNLKDNGTPALLDGTDGQVMVEIPEHYRRFETEGTKRRCHLSTVAIPGFHHVPKYYVSAYEATVDRTSTLKLSSVVNSAAAFRGGNNNAAWDDTYRDLRGMPATAISLTNFRAYARNRGNAWNCNLYEVHTTVAWLYFTEYANFNCKLAFNPSGDANGYRQGGLGPGVTTLASADWTAYNSQYPIIPCGTTNGFGNSSGIVQVTLPAEYPVPITVQVPSYRGVENIFGHIWKWTDGLKCRIQADDSGGLSEFYVCNNPSDFQDTNYNGYELRGLLPRVNGYVKEILLGESGDIMPLLLGASSTTYFSVYFYTSLPATGESQRGVRFGGSSYSGSLAGLVFASTHRGPSSAHASIGSRLCFLPA